jgi:peptidyl-dipeptidase Dcp
MLAEDAYNWFQTHGGLTRANGQRFRDMVLSRGNTLDYAEMYRGFAGHDASINPYLEFYGLPVTAAGASPPPAAVPAPPPPALPAAKPNKGERGE